MGSTPVETSGLLALPLEILQEILLYLDRKSLTSVRSTSRLGLKLATPNLFCHFALYPHFNSFYRLLEISQRTEIAIHVQDITFDARFLGIPDVIDRQTRLTSGASENNKKKIEDVTLYAEQGLHIDVAMDVLALASYLQKALPALLRLRKFTVRDAAPPGDRYHSSVLGFQMPHFYKQVAEQYCGQLPEEMFEVGLQEAQQCDGSYCLPILMSLHAMSGSVEEFQLSGFKWTGLFDEGDFGHHPVLLQNALSSIKTLKLVEPLEIRFAGYGSMLSLQRLLMRTTNLEQLHITFHHSDQIYIKRQGQDLIDRDVDIVCQSYFDPPRVDLKFSQLPSKLTWSSKIKIMELEGMRCKSREMKSILKECSPTLKRLRLTRLLLLPDTTGGALACLVKFLKWMQKELNLTAFRMGGFYTNGGMQCWTLYDRLWEQDTVLYEISSKKRFELASLLLGRVENFVVNGGPCPIDDFAIPRGHYDLHRQHQDSKVPETVSEAAWSEGDLSWIVHYQGQADESDLDSLDAPFGYTSDFDSLDEEHDMDPWGDPFG